jgi:nucleoid-associated protein YgaU
LTPGPPFRFIVARFGDAEIAPHSISRLAGFGKSAQFAPALAGGGSAIRRLGDLMGWQISILTGSKALIGCCGLAVAGTALVIGPTELRHLLGGSSSEVASAVRPEARPNVAAEARVDPKTESKPLASPEPKLAAAEPVAPSAPAPAAPASKPAGALAETQSQATAALADLAPIKAPPAATDSGPRFDVARVDEHGEAAVIAGQAAPGARVELLRDGQPLDTATADASGQFVMTPPQLPAGSYELSLRAKAPDGSVAQSTRNVAVTVAEAAPPPARVASAQAAPVPVKPAADKQDVVAALPAPHLASAPDHAAVRPKTMGAPKSRLLARGAVEPTTAAEIITGTTTESGGNRVIARGDSLWAISRLAYGDGGRYALIFNANRGKIHNPNLIYPGQTFVVPQKAQ